MNSIRKGIMEKWKNIKNYFPTFPQCLATMEMLKSQNRTFGYNKNIRFYGFPTFPHSFLKMKDKNIFRKDFKNYSLRSYSKKKRAFRPLFFYFTEWRFYCRMSGGDQPESLAVLTRIGNHSSFSIPYKYFIV